MAFFDLNMNSKRITDTQDPSGNQDVATKNYVDTRNLVINDQITNYTLDATDVNKRVIMNVASTNTITVNNSVFDTGDTVFIANKGAGLTTITAGSGVTVDSCAGFELQQFRSALLLSYSPSIFSIFLSSVAITIAVNYLVIAGGGGTSTTGGGGGAGGYRTSDGPSGGGSIAEAQLVLDQSTDYIVTVGQGGTGGSTGTNGSNSVFFTITSIGGGAGQINGSIGGSGGGSYEERVGAAGTPDQGFAGSRQAPAGVGIIGGGGGGGGAGEAGQESAVNLRGGRGGNGIASSITGSSITRGGGGGGGGDTGGGGVGGVGGGGNGGTFGIPGVAGSPNTGGGAGGGYTAGGNNGGSGAVFVKYTNNIPDMIIGTGLVIDNGSGGNVSGTNIRLSPSFTPVGYKVYFFKQGTGNVRW